MFKNGAFALWVAQLSPCPIKTAILYNGVVCHPATDAVQSERRLRTLGFVYQAHHLLNDWTARENIMLPLLKAGASLKDAEKRADHLLECMELTHRTNDSAHAFMGDVLFRHIAKLPNHTIATT